MSRHWLYLVLTMVTSFFLSISRLLLPRWIYRRFFDSWDHVGLKKYFYNTSWIVIARLISYITSFFIVIIVARYLGPENLGKLSYAQSFVSILSIFASLGIDVIVYRELVANPEKENEIIGTAIIAKLVFGTITFLTTVLAAFLLNDNIVLTWMIAIIALTFIFQPFSTVHHIFNAKVYSKYPSYISIFVSIFLPLCKLTIIFLGQGIIYFAIIIAFEALLNSFGYLLLYIKILRGNPRNWSFSLPIFKELFRDSWPLLLAGLSGYVYARIDQVMIQHFIDSTAVGLYEIAVKLTEPLSFLPGILIGSLFPAIINAKKHNVHEYKKRLRYLTILCLSISFILVSIIFLFSHAIIHFLFGDQYLESNHVLRVYVWSNLGTVCNSLIFNYFIAENKSQLFLRFTLLGALFNVAANMILIPKYSIVGAAYATVLTLCGIVVIFIITYLFSSKTGVDTNQ